MKKVYLLLFTVFAIAVNSFAQPGAVGNNNLSGSPFLCTALTAPSGAFFQARIQATQSSAAATWEFPKNCSYTNGDGAWRPYAAGTAAITFNSTLAPVGGTGSALYNIIPGGAAGTLPLTTNGNYYTFNVENVLPPLDAKMAVLETNYNPVTISTVSNTTPASTNNSVLVTCTTSASPSANEFVYVRYSTDNTFALSSAIAQFTINGITGQALIPCQVAGPVYYYLFTSNRTSAQIASDVATYGRIAYDMLTLNIKNNGGLNYNYTQGSGSVTNFEGVYSIPSCYATVGAFVTALNGGTVTAPVTCYAIGGSATETATVGGIDITQTGTVANPIVFQKFGSGSYIIQSSSTLTVGRLYDGIIKLTGADYITIDGFTLQENPANIVNTPAASNTMTEWGVALLHSSTTNGAQNNTIQNNTISLNRTYANTFGIYSNVGHSTTVVETTEEITNNTTAPNNSNKIYGNAISNVAMGITFIGSGTAANQDVSNDIGGSSSATGNTITNWGGIAALSTYVSNSVTSYCIFVNHQTSENVSYNTLTGAAVSGTAVTFVGIRKDYTVAASQPTGTVTSAITYNTITMSSAFASGTFDAILSQGMTALNTATINITNNTILNCVISGAASSSTMIGIANSSAPGTLNISANLIKGNTSTATTGGFTGIQNSGAVVTTVNIGANQIGLGSGSSNAPITFSAVTTGGATGINGINNTGGAATATLNLGGNSINGITVVSSGQIQGVANSGGTTGTIVNITNDSLINTVISGVAASSSILAFSNTAAVTTLNMNYNYIYGNTSTATTGGFQGLKNSGAIVTTLNMNNNTLGIAGNGAVTFTAATNQDFNCIYNTGGASTCTVTMDNNYVDGISVVSTRTFNVIWNNAPSAAFAYMDGNQLGTTTGTLITFTGAQVFSFAALNSGAGSSTATTSIQSNAIKGVVHSTAGSCSEFYIFSNAPNLIHTVANNTFTNMNVNTTGNIYLIYDNTTKASGQTFTYDNNSIVTGFNKSGAGGSFYGFFSGGSSVNGSITNITNNSFTGVTLTGATIFYGINATDGASSVSGPTKTITGNTFNNITSGTGTVYVMYLDKGVSITCSGNAITNINSSSPQTFGIYWSNVNSQGTHFCSSNTISNMSTAGSVYGIFSNGGSIPTLNINGNNISGLLTGTSGTSVIGIEVDAALNLNVYDNTISGSTSTSTVTAALHGIIIQSGTTVNVYRNKVYNLNVSGALTLAGPLIYGINFYGTPATVNVYNNFISDLKAPNVSDADAIRGITVNSSTASSTFNVYYNSIYLNASSGGTDFGTSGVYHTTNATSTTAALNMIDNIIVNTSTANGTGVTAAYRRSDATLTNYASTSDNNLLYAGTPSVTKLIHYDGTTGYQTLAAYQTLVSTRDANSISEMPVFTSTTDLHLTSANCSIDNKGTPIPGFTTDIDLNTRNVTVPDIGADEFTAMSGILAGVTGGHPTQVCNSKAVASYGTSFYSGTCDLIAKILPSGAIPVSGMINTCVTILPISPFPTFNSEPYVQRYYDIEPVTLPATSTATITLYYKDQEFEDFNVNNGAWPDLPTFATGGTGSANLPNLKVTQWHGTALNPWDAGNYTGTAVLLKQGFDPGISSVFYNATTGFWEVTVKVSGFSGFYVHTNPSNPLPINLDYLKGVKQADKHLLNWKVTCNTTPRATLTLERSADSRNFSNIYSITADALRCQQPFDHTDLQPLPGMNYYRLKMVDADGKITYSNTIALLNATRGFALMNIAPNPVTGDKFKLNATAATATKMELVISDMQGRVMSRQTLMLPAGYKSIDINVNSLAPGTYNMYGTAVDDRSGLIRFVKQ